MAEYDAESDGLLFRNPAATVPQAVAFGTVSGRMHSFDTDRRSFIGGNRALCNSQALEADRLACSTGIDLEAIAAMRSDVLIAAGHEESVVFVLGQAQGKDDACRIMQKYKDPVYAREALEKTRAWWLALLGEFIVSTQDRTFDAMVNYWLRYQAIAAHLFARTGYYQSGGAIGFRDQLQTSLVGLYTDPALTRRQIILHAAHQFEEGDVQHWWHPQTNLGSRTTISDNLLWLAYALSIYVRATGDEQILDVTVPYLSGPLLEANSCGCMFVPRISEKKDTVYAHALRAIEYALARFGAHGLPLMGSGDWNDGMSGIGPMGKGESVWLAFFLYDILQGFAPLAERQEGPAQSAALRARAEQLRSAIEASSWDGEWYARAFTDDGLVVGSAANEEWKIDLVPQVWAAISGAADPVRRRTAINSVKERLVSGKLVLLADTAFDKGPIDPGTLRHYPPGVRENAGQYTHAATWLPFALSLTGETEEAYRIFRNLLPANHDQSWYEAEPFWISADVSPNGKAGWNMYTGSASWLFRAGIEAVLGLSFERGRLVSMNRPLPVALGTVRLRVHGRDYELSPDGDLSQSDGGDIDMDAALPRILKEMCCQECYIPDFAEEIKFRFPPELLAQWRAIIREVFDAAVASRVTIPVVLEKSENEDPMLSVTDGTVHIRSPWVIHQLLVHTLPVEHVFEAIEHSSLPEHDKDRMFRSFFTCLNNTAFVYLILTLLGYEVKIAMGSGPVFAVIPYSNGTHLFVDLFTGVIKAVDIPSFYARKGKYLVLAKRLSIRRHFELKLSEFDVRSLRDEELLQMFYSYIRIGDATCLMVVMNKKVAHIYDQLGEKQTAYRYYKKSLDLDPDYIVAHIGLAFLCLERMDIRCAVQRFAAAQKLNPCEYGAYLGLGLAYRFQRKRGKAVDNFARAIAIAPSHLDMISTMDQGLQDAVLLRLSAYI
ncbi:MAG: hypothetical protein PHS64_07855, partial [Candidatus Omnitrophica bacterium]|nr:hypothetical protein [Candidatus Omnitrophota bacterium]